MKTFTVWRASSSEGVSCSPYCYKWWMALIDFRGAFATMNADWRCYVHIYCYNLLAPYKTFEPRWQRSDCMQGAVWPEKVAMILPRWPLRSYIFYLCLKVEILLWIFCYTCALSPSWWVHVDENLSYATLCATKSLNFGSSWKPPRPLSPFPTVLVVNIMIMRTQR